MTRTLEPILRDRGLIGPSDLPPDSRARIVLGTLAPSPTGPVLFQRHWRLDPEQTYYYPASAVKLIAVASALSRLSLAVPFDLDFDRSFVRLRTDRAGSRQPHSSVGTLIRRIGAVSCNHSYNTLFDALGARAFRDLFERLRMPARLTHHLSPPIVRPIKDYLRSDGATWSLVERAPGLRSETFEVRPSNAPCEPSSWDSSESIGRAHFVGSERREGPLDFSSRNRVELADLQRILCAVCIPWAHCGLRLFMRDNARRFLIDSLTDFPRVAAHRSAPNSFSGDEATLADSWGKLFLEAIGRSFPGFSVRHVSKFGQAYGFTTENALLLAPGKPEVFLAASVYTNSGGVVGGDQYEYDFATNWFTRLASVILEELWA